MIEVPLLPVTIVIPVRNEVANLEDMFDSLLALSPKPSEVVFVDTGSSDGSAELIEQWMAQAAHNDVRCQLCFKSGALPGAARNAGVEVANQPWIAFLDAGIFPQHDWLKMLWRSQQQLDVQGVYGTCKFHSAHPFGRMICAVSYGQGRSEPVLPASLFHKDVFEKAGYFEEFLRSGEDRLWNYSVSMADIPTAHCSDAVVEYCHFPESLSRALNKWFTYEQSASVAGLDNAHKCFMLLAIALIYVLSGFGVPGALFFLVAYLVFRGVVEPYRRSYDKPWWNYWWQPIVMIPTAALLDLAAMAGRTTAWMGFSKYKLDVADAKSSVQKKYCQDTYSQKRLAILLWVAFYAFSTLVALLFQKVLLPRQLNMHAGNGLLFGDSEFFHAAAIRLADQISNSGWGAWHLFPEVNAYGNVGVIGAIYAIHGPDPSLIIPLNAAVHAFAGVMIFLIISAIGGEGRAARWAGMVSAVLFVAFPSTLSWYGQLHKDGYAILGVLIILWSWVVIQLKSPRSVNYVLLICAQIAGFALIGAVRPYALKILLFVTVGIAFLLIFVPNKNFKFTGRRLSKLFFFCCSIVLNFIVIKYYSHLLSSWAGGSNLTSGGENYSEWVSSEGWTWESSNWLGSSINSNFELLAKTRAGLIEYGISVGARSMIDVEEVPSSIYSVLMYMPRALQIALFAPFPFSWFRELNLTSIVASAEMSISYLGFAGLPFLFFGKNRFTILFTLLFAMLFLVIYGFVNANLGTLYRLRYVYVMLVVGLGILGWAALFKRYSKKNRRESIPLKIHEPVRGNTDQVSAVQAGRWIVVSSGLLVLGLTFLGFIGFFLRDMLLANKFGFSARLDSFYLALLLPMFAVSILSIPIGNAFTPIYLETLNRGREVAAEFVLAVLRHVSFMLVVACTLVFISTPFIFHILRPYQSDSFRLWIDPIFYMALPILALSGRVVICNAILNAHGNFKVSSGAQLLVPFCSVFLFYIFGEQGVMGAMLGMLLGQILNLLVVQHSVKRLGVLSLEKDSLLSIRKEKKELMSQYLPQLASALFVSLAVPVSTMIAMRLPEGSVAALNLGTKAVMFITGLLNAVLSTVMLPYFSSLVINKNLFFARRELSFYLSLSILISVPMTVILFFWAKPLIGLVFPVGNVNSDDLSLIAGVMQYGVLQLPFFASNALLLKFAIANRHIVAIWATTIVGLLVNIIASISLINYMGIVGIALGASLAMLVSAGLLFAILIHARHVSSVDAIQIGLSLLLFLTLMMCLHFSNSIGVGICVLGFVVNWVDYFGSIRACSKEFLPENA